VAPPRNLDEWLDLASAAGSLTGNFTRGGTVVAREALGHLLGDEFWVDAMDVALGSSEASEIARSLLGHVRPLCVVEPLAARAAVTADSTDERSTAIEVLQVVARPEALAALYAIAVQSEGLVRREVDWALVQGMLDLDRPFSDEALEQTIETHLQGSTDPGVRELAEALSDDVPHGAALDPAEVRALLGHLCTTHGFCLPPTAVEYLARRPPPRVSDFVDAVFFLEGLDPETAETHLYRSLFAEVAAAYDRR